MAMSMNKVIHGAVRRDLARFLDALDRFPDGDRTRAEQLGRAWDNFLAQLTRHHEGEHEIVWPVLAGLGVEQDLLAQMDAEHERLAEALAVAGEKIAALRRTASAESAAEAHAAMRTLRTVAEEHLSHEEAALEPVIAAKKDDPSLKEMGRRLAKVSPTEGGVMFAWVTDGASPEEEAAIREHIPGPVLVMVRGLFGRSYRRDVASVWR